MKRNTTAALVLMASLAGAVSAQDWYHDRDARYQDNHWRRQVFMQVRTDLDHIGFPPSASEKEDNRLNRTKQELTKMQGDLDQGRFDSGF